MEQTVAYQCPNCGATLEFDAEQQAFACLFCLSKFNEEEVKAANSEEARREREAEREAYNAQMKEYQCSNCGAEILADEHTVASECCYCHSPVVLVGRLSGEMKPQRIVPFRYGRDEAKAKFFKFAKKKWFVPNHFFAEEQVDKITGIYYPFWITDADADGGMQAKAHRLRVWRVGNIEYTETLNFRIHRRGSIHFEDITSSAFSQADKKMLEGVLPYPSDALQEFSMPYLSGFVAKKRDMEREALSEEVRERMQGYTESLLRRTVQGYAGVAVEDLQLEVHASRWEYSLLPLWILTYIDKKGKTYTYAMNGHTGKIYGELPVSPWKLGILFGAVATVLTGLFTLIGGWIF